MGAYLILCFAIITLILRGRLPSKNRWWPVLSSSAEPKTGSNTSFSINVASTGTFPRGTSKRGKRAWILPSAKLKKRLASRKMTFELFQTSVPMKNSTSSVVLKRSTIRSFFISPKPNNQRSLSHHENTVAMPGSFTPMP